jgi:Fe2+ transport system protein FeoA
MKGDGLAAERTPDAPRRVFRLDELPHGVPAVVRSVRGPDDLLRRLLEMGICTGTSIVAVRRAPLGDPIEFCLRGYYLSLRRDEARWIEVETAPAGLREEGIEDVQLL